MSQITTQTLRFFKASTLRQRVEVAGLMDSVLALYAGKLVNSSVEVVREYEDDVEAVCFEGELRQALNNLIGNAIDSMWEGGRLRVRARYATDFASGRRGVRLTIADTGMGMSAAVQAKIFEPFFTTKGIRGTGLGLWITQELVGKEDGWLRMRSREGVAHQGRRGTVFALFLPELRRP